MDWTLIVGGIIVLFVLCVFGGGLAYWFYISTRPKMMTWEADVYQKSDSKIKIDEENGKIKYDLREVKPYTHDIIQKIDKKDGSTIYWLQKLHLPCAPVTADCVDVWGSGNQNKRVSVLIDNGSVTVLKKGYDNKLGSFIFRPMEISRQNMLMSQISMRKARLETSKDILAAITPIIMAIVAILGVVMVVYLIMSSSVKIADSSSKAQIASAQAQENSNRIFVNLAKALNISLDNVNNTGNIQKESPPVMPS